MGKLVTLAPHRRFSFSSPAGAEEKFYVSLNGSLQQIHLVSFSVLKTAEICASS